MLIAIWNTIQSYCVESTKPAWVQILLMLSFFGGFGGILGSLGLVALPRILAEGIKDYGSRRRLGWVVFVGMLTGAGGAMAFGVILVLDGKFKVPFDDEARVLVAGTAIAAGYLGNSVLKKIGDGLLEEKVDHLRDQTREGLALLRTQSAELAAAFGAAGNALSYPESDRSADHLRLEAIEKLVKVLPFFLEQRTSAVFLGRCYRQLGRYLEGVDALEKFLGYRRNAHIPLDENDAVSYYNQACYFNLAAEAAERSSDGTRAEELRKNAWNKLKLAVKIIPSYAKDAAQDPDLKTLEGNGRRFADLK